MPGEGRTRNGAGALGDGATCPKRSAAARWNPKSGQAWPMLDVGERHHGVRGNFPFTSGRIHGYRKCRVRGANCTTFNEGGGARSDYVRISGSSSLAGSRKYSVGRLEYGAGDGAEDGSVDDPATRRCRILRGHRLATRGFNYRRLRCGGPKSSGPRKGVGAGQTGIGESAWMAGELGNPAQAEDSA